jgi:hypothetical protein
VDLWNDCRASQNGPLNSNKTQSSQFSHQKQYPLKPEGQGGFLPIINSLKKKKTRATISFSSLCNTPILAVCKGPNKWRLVEDLKLINEAAIPLHPIVPNPYTLLTQIPSKAQYYSVLNLKDAFFCIPLHPDSQLLFAFEDPTNPSQQLTWTVLPQGFRDSPHLFVQALTVGNNGTNRIQFLLHP